MIIGIHGLANKPKPEVLSGWWEESIREGLRNREVDAADFTFVMVHWAKFLYKNLQHEDPDFDFDPLFVDQPYKPATPGTLEKYDEWIGDRFRAWGTDIGGSIMDKVRGPLGLSGIEDRLLESKVRDLHYYYNKDKHLRDGNEMLRPARQVLMGELTDAIKPFKDDRLMLIAHSMGTIIAYDVLRDLGQDFPDFNVEQFVTIGSPLGLSAVKARIYSERRYADLPVRTPSVVKERWVNYADPADPVAAETHLRGDYGPNATGVRVVDDLVHNDYTAPDGERKPHKSFGYLRTPELSDQIKDFLQG
ncbi:MAG: hypothetical protein BZY87_03900 [SAR202 cluster bacterium Io17-Chloro-G6]|nr:MAG: hypothetical protein BZY87_03900 [SAR202 cluster bacterium Io17-Chloro-G6]